MSNRTRRLPKYTNKVGFIILRHVNSENTNLYWQEAYDCIRHFYPENKVVIIDDNSKQDFISNKQLYKTIIIQSEFPGRGELLPYYYFSRNKWFDTAVVIHDSVFINKYINFKVKNYKFIWDFNSNISKKVRDEMRLIKALDNNESLLKLYNDRIKWRGCFGAMSIIEHKFLKKIDTKYDLSKLLPIIRSRKNRMSFERIFACMMQANYKRDVLLGDIILYCNWGYSFDDYIKCKDNIDLPIVKVWTGR
jgi:hypothetical protein